MSKWTSRSPNLVPLIGVFGGSVDADGTEVTVNRMTEEELLKGLEGWAPPEEKPGPEIEAGDEDL